MGGFMIGEYPVNINPCKFYFGDGYTIMTRMCERGGNDIHVAATRPIRNKCLEILKSVKDVWWTCISESNQKAINLCLKCGFEFVESKRINHPFNGKIEVMNIYRRNPI